MTSDEQIAMLRDKVRKAVQMASVCRDWNLEEVEIDGEMIDTYDLLDEFREALAATAPDAESGQDGGWRSMDSAPRDGTPFLTYDPALADDSENGPYDIGYWSDDWGEFVKFGCGLDGVTLWHPIIHPTSTEAEGAG